MNILIYTKSGCPNCVSAKQLLKAKGLPFEEMNLDNLSDWNDFQEAYPHFKQMPQIFIDEQRVGGFAGLQAALKQLSK